MFLEFMSAEIWNGLVVGTVLIGLALAIVRLLQDREAHHTTQRPGQPKSRRERRTPHKERPRR